MPDTKKEHPDIETENKFIKKTPNFVGWAVFVFTISIVIISLISVVFPSFVASNNTLLKDLAELGIPISPDDPFEIGVWAMPLIATNLVVFGLAILYFKKRLPHLKRPIDFVFSFEVSKKVAFFTLVAILAIYVASSAGDLAVKETWEDYEGVKKRVESWSPDQVVKRFEPHVRYFFISSSMMLFGYYTIIPFLASIALLITTYFITKEISKKRFAGIISVVIVLQSNIFLTYDSTVSYTNFWILFYLLSLYVIVKAWPLSPVFYFLSIFSKALTAMFMPMSLFVIFRSKISRKKKIIIGSATAIIILAGVLVSSSGLGFSPRTGLLEEFNPNEFWLGFTSFSYQLRFDGLVLVFLLPLIVGLYIASRNGIKNADSIMVLIGGLLLTSPLLTGFSDLTNQPYRFVPLIVFFAIGVGTLLSKRRD